MNTRIPVRAVLVLLLSMVSSSAWGAQRISGIVVDSSGTPVQNAALAFDDGAVIAITDRTGAFAMDVGFSQSSLLDVSASGYLTKRIDLSDQSQPLRIVLEPVRLEERITVTAVRTPLRIDETAASVAIVSKAELDVTAAVTLDDALRQVPGFTLFRRSGSRVANPTTQGVSLRGVGASGAGRALVLDDGIPLNDPFGGWIYWGRVPRESLDRVELLRGGGSDLYGSGAMGGVVHLVRRDVQGTSLSLQGSYGAGETPELSLFAGFGGQSWSAALSTEVFRTDGYVLVAEDQRGPIDMAANSERASVDLTLQRTWAERGLAFIRGASFGEERENGTPLQTNDTAIRQLSAGGNLLIGDAHVTGRIYRSTQIYDQSFTAVSADRTTEALTRLQRVPSEAEGGSVQVTALSGVHTIVAGVEARSVEGRSDERGFGFTESVSSAGGTQTTSGIFVEDIMRLSNRLSVTAGLRFDTWRNHDASRELNGEVQPLVSREEDALSPRFSAVYRAAERWTLVGSAYQAFRAPTLNELYRGFRVGNVVTEPNESLGAERLTGFEGGVIFTGARERSRLRATGFWIDIDDPIANRTLSVRPSLITRRRENLGSSRSRGLEIDGEALIADRWSLHAGYLHVIAEIVGSPGSVELEGSRLPQVPEHSITAQVRYQADAFNAALQTRWSSDQFDDDRNQLRLGSFFTADALLSVPLRTNFDLVAAVENLFDERYEAGRTPVITLGPPRSWRLGFRAQWRPGS